MSIGVIPNSGPFNDPLLDEGRQAAMIALDEGNVRLPPEMIDYLIWLEQRHLDLSRRHKAEFLRSSWEERKPKEADHE